MCINRLIDCIFGVVIVSIYRVNYNDETNVILIMNGINFIIFNSVITSITLFIIDWLIMN